MTAPAFTGWPVDDDSGTAIPDGDSTIDDIWGTPQPDDNGSDLFDHENFEPDASFVDEGGSAPDPSMLDEKPRSRKAKDYEKEIRGLFRFAFKATVTNPRTVNDAAALLHHGPAISEALGDLAAEDKKVGKIIDFLTETTDNSSLALMSVTVPLILQILRNHESEVDEAVASVRRVRVPFRKGKYIDLKMRGIKLPRKARMFTEDPRSLAVRTFTDPQIAAAMMKQGIKVDY